MMQIGKTGGGAEEKNQKEENIAKKEDNLGKEDMLRQREDVKPSNPNLLSNNEIIHS